MKEKRIYEKEEHENRTMIQLLSFRQGKEVYAVRINSVREVIDSIAITPIPLVPHYIKGVINLRGNVLPVIDLNARFYGDRGGIEKSTSIIIVELQSHEEIVSIGLMIDAVKEVMMFPEEEIDPTPDFGTNIRTDFISGIARHEENYLILLDINAVLNIEELSDFTCPDGVLEERNG
ncbi:MAG: chemotaxis protein CheW [Spirochaetes bacterium]|jgi:purine-binding chemotaxis protein CheW|nr:chemotaxis protein CheW [Spirochaetota bacterium]